VENQSDNQPGILGGREGRPGKARPLGGKRTGTSNPKLLGDEGEDGKGEKAKAGSRMVPELRKSFRG
jgi:hypothetical protein